MLFRDDQQPTDKINYTFDALSRWPPYNLLRTDGRTNGIFELYSSFASKKKYLFSPVDGISLFLFSQERESHVKLGPYIDKQMVRCINR